MRRRASFLPPVLLENKTNVFRPSAKSGKVMMQFVSAEFDIDNVVLIQPEYFREIYESNSSGVLSAINYVPVIDDMRWSAFRELGANPQTWADFESGSPDQQTWGALIS